MSYSQPPSLVEWEVHNVAWGGPGDAAAAGAAGQAPGQLKSAARNPSGSHVGDGDLDLDPRLDADRGDLRTGNRGTVVHSKAKK